MTLASIVRSQHAARIIDRCFKGQRNLLTPIRLDCYLTPRHAIEVSGVNPTNDPGGFCQGLHSVTVVERLSGQSRRDLSASFATRQEADAYILKLKTMEG